MVSKARSGKHEQPQAIRMSMWSAVRILPSSALRPDCLMRYEFILLLCCSATESGCLTIWTQRQLTWQQRGQWKLQGSPTCASASPGKRHSCSGDKALTNHLNQQIVVVIGGSSGIGYEVARQTSAQGARLILT